jgi:hypothetical protein
VKSCEDAEAIGVVVTNRILELGGGALLASVKNPQGLPAQSTTDKNVLSHQR